MRLRFLGFVFVLVILSSQLYSIVIHEIIFPYKNLIFNTMGIARSNYTKVTVNKEEVKFLKFTYEGKEYTARLYNYGAIILSQGDKKSLINVDMSKYKYKTFITPRVIRVGK